MQSDADFWKNLFPFLHVYIVHDLSINLQIEFLEYFLILEKYLQIKFEIIRFTSPRFKRVTIFRLSIISITSIVILGMSACKIRPLEISTIFNDKSMIISFNSFNVSGRFRQSVRDVFLRQFPRSYRPRLREREW